MKTRDKERLLRRLSEEFKTIRHTTTTQNVEVCGVWYKPQGNVNAIGDIVGACPDRFYQGANRYLVRWDKETQLPVAEVVDSSLLASHDISLQRNIEYRVAEVLNYIKQGEAKK